MKYLTISEAAERSGLTPRRLQQLCKSGELRDAVKEGRSWKIPESSLAVLLERSSGRSGLLPLPVGISGYIEAVSKYYYIDKTLMIRDIIDTLPKVSLFTRPRRFGKTLNMDMLRVFFERTEEDTSIYFKDKAIWSCGENYRAYQGRYPVIYLSFKDVKYPEWENAFKDIADNIISEYARHSELEDSARCNSVEKSYYRRIIEGQADEVELARSLAMLSAMLRKHYGTETVILIDEYDTPIQQGYESGYYDKVVGFVRNLFSGAFKDNKNLAFGFLTGILRVAKESIFSGMNNLKVNSIMDERFSEYFGFTKDEVARMLEYYGREDRFGEVCEWYDGYCFGSREIFNPWSVINYIDDGCVPRAFWQSTGSNEIIGDIIADASPEIIEKLRLLMQGGSVTAYVDTGVIYPEIRSDPTSVFSFLLVAGYLRNNGTELQSDGNYMCQVSLPNKEIALVYAKEVISRSKPRGAESVAAAIGQAIYENDAEKLRAGIEKYLMQTISFYDAANEAFYQGLMIGLCAIMNDRYTVRSNRESGLGRFDIQLCPYKKLLPGFIIELKVSKDASDDLGKLSGTALSQIGQQKYDEEMRSLGINKVIMIGIAFRGKGIAVAQKQ